MGDFDDDPPPAHRPVLARQVPVTNNQNTEYISTFVNELSTALANHLHENVARERINQFINDHMLTNPDHRAILRHQLAIIRQEDLYPMNNGGKRKSRRRKSRRRKSCRRKSRRR